MEKIEYDTGVLVPNCANDFTLLIDCFGITLRVGHYRSHISHTTRPSPDEPIMKVLRRVRIANHFIYGWQFVATLIDRVSRTRIGKFLQCAKIKKLSANALQKKRVIILSRFVVSSADNVSIVGDAKRGGEYPVRLKLCSQAVV